MAITASVLEEITLEVTQTVDIEAPIEIAFDAMLEELGPNNQTPDGDPLSMVLEARPGGRWFRDLGGDEGHLWGHVQVIKRPTLLEINGPMFMSYPAVSHVQYRLETTATGTRLTLRHQALGLIDPDHRAAVDGGWGVLVDRIKNAAEG